MLRGTRAAVAAMLLMVPGVVHAAPGAGEKVYGATLNKDATEVEFRYGRLSGGTADTEDAAVVELSHAIGQKVELGVLLETEREPGEGRKVESFAFEAIAPVAHIAGLGLDVAVYGEYEIGRHDEPDGVEGKLLLERRRGPFDARLNLIAHHDLASHAPVDLGYAVSADWAVLGEFRLGAEAFGNAGSTQDFLPRDEHYLGPMVKTEIEHLPGRGELEIEAGYLFALGKARDETDGQLRLVLEYEFHF